MLPRDIAYMLKNMMEATLKYYGSYTAYTGTPANNQEQVH